MQEQRHILVSVEMRSLLGLPPTPHWATTSCVAQSMSASSGAMEQICFVWDSSNNKSTGSSNHTVQEQRHILVNVLMRSDLGLPPTPHWATTSCVAQSMSASSGAMEENALFGIGVKINRQVQAITLCRSNATSS
jgi:hypothetical protein